MARRISINLCLNLIGTRSRFRSQTIASKPESRKARTNSGHGLTNKNKETREKIMVAIDSSEEAKTALHWALSHAVHPDDTVVLLHVVKPCTIGEKSEHGGDPDENRLLNAMKCICQAKRPEVHVELSLVEGREHGPTIVEMARKLEISLLIIGQKKRSVTWRLLTMWTASGGTTIRDTTEYCVQNTACAALAVRRKSKKDGGYLITTKRLKNFWLLA